MKRYNKKVLDMLEKFANGTASNTTTATNRAYALSNEFLNKTYEIFPLDKKRYATVGSSGDQVLNAIYNDCYDITLIDGNIYSQAFTEYKIALIKTFDYEEFNNIFFGHQMFNPIIYAKISHYLSPQSRAYFDEIMLETSCNTNTELTPRDIERTMLQGLIRNLRVGNCDFYNDSFDYNYLRRKLIEGDFRIKYIVAEFSEFPDKLTGEYDVISLSNIYDYVNPKEHKRVVESLFDNHLKRGGCIHIEYDLNRAISDESKKRFAYTIRGQNIYAQTLQDEKNSNVDTIYYVRKPIDYIETEKKLEKD